MSHSFIGVVFMKLFLSLISCCAALMLLPREALSVEIAVIPYRVHNPSLHFPESAGKEYARLLAVAASVKKSVTVKAPGDVAMDLKRLSIDPGKTVTEEELGLYGRTAAVDYILAGTISRARGELLSRSVLYSVKDGSIAARVRVSGPDYFFLCGSEIREALVGFDDRQDPEEPGALDAVFLVDLSYAVNSEWKWISNGILSFSASVIDRMGMDSRIYILPFSSRTGPSSASLSENSILSVRRVLENLKPAGGADRSAFYGSLRNAVRNTRWRRKASRMIVIISNSPMQAGAVPDTLAVEARSKGILIHSLCLGLVQGDECEAIERTATITGGRAFHAAYYSRASIAGGDSVELFLENGRLFHSPVYRGEWKRGLVLHGHTGAGADRPLPFLEEIFYNEKKLRVSPGTMADRYALIRGERILSATALKSNAEDILEGLAGKLAGPGSSAILSPGRVLLSDGNVSVWVNVRDRSMIAYFRAKKGKSFFPLGVSFRRDQSRVYGLDVVPRTTGLTPDYIPDMLRTRLEKVVKNPEAYISGGLFYPPLWFIQCRVEEVRAGGALQDIRD